MVERSRETRNRVLDVDSRCPGFHTREMKTTPRMNFPFSLVPNWTAKIATRSMESFARITFLFKVAPSTNMIIPYYLKVFLFASSFVVTESINTYTNVEHTQIILYIRIRYTDFDG